MPNSNEKQTKPLSKKQRKGSKNRHAREDKKLDSSFTKLHIKYGRKLYKVCTNILNAEIPGSELWVLTLLVILSLLTGRTMERLLEIPQKEGGGLDDGEYWEVKGGRCWLCYKPQIPRNNLESELRTINAISLFEVIQTDFLKIPMPKVVSKHLVSFLSTYQKSFDKKQLPKKKIPTEIKNEISRLVQQSQVFSFMRYCLAKRDLPAIIPALLNGLDSKIEVGLHYAQIQSKAVLEQYYHYLLVLGVPLEDMPEITSVLVGSSLKIKDDAIKFIFRQYHADWADKLQNDSQSYMLENFNDIVYYIHSVIMLLTAHRPKNIFLGTIHAVDFRSGYLRINDKNGRIIKLCPTAELQLQYYVDFLKSLYCYLVVEQSPVAKLIEKSLNGQAPLFFLLNKHHSRSDFSKNNICKLVANPIPLPENALRHFTYNKLFERLSAEDLSAILGHLMNEKAGDSQFSGKSLSYLHKTAGVLENIATELDIQPLNPCSNIPSINTLRLPSNFPKLSNKTGEKGLYWSDRRFALASSMSVWEDAFKDKLSSLDKKSLSAEKLLPLILYSAATRGGLTNEKLFLSLFKVLVKKKTPLFRFGDIDYLDLSHEVNQGPYNLKIGDEDNLRSFRQMYWPVDPLTLNLIYEYKRLNTKFGYKIVESAAFSVLFNGLFSHIEVPKGINTLSKFLENAAWVSWTEVGADFSYCLANNASFVNPNFSLNKASLISRNIAPQPISFDNEEIADALKAPQKSKSSTYWLSGGSKNTKEKLLRILSDTESKAGAQRKLEEWLLTASHNMPLSITLLLEWFEDKLPEIKLSTAIRYHGDITEAWLNVMSNQKLEYMDAEEILSLYTRMVDNEVNKNKQERIRDRLRQIHDFANGKFNLPKSGKLSNFLRSNSHPTFVRTSVVDYRHYYNVLNALDQLDQSDIFCNQLKLITMIAFRCGLRISEILKLKIEDMDPATDWSVFIRGNRYKSNKNDSSLRLLEQTFYLSDKELDYLKSYYQMYCSDREPSERLFGYEGENLPLFQKQVSTIISNAFRQSTSNSEFVFHNLRHSYSSNMQCILEKEYTLASEMTGFTKQQCERLRTKILGNKKFERDIYWQLSRTVGHAAPDQTILTYSHFSSELLYNKLSSAVWKSPELEHVLKKVANFRAGDLKNMTIQQITGRLMKRHRKSYTEIYETNGAKKYTEQGYACNFPPTITTYRKAINLLEHGCSTKEVVAQFNISETTLEAIDKSCKILMAIMTNDGGWKYKTEADIKKIESGDLVQKLAPSLPDGEAAIRMAISLNSFIKSQEKDGRKKKKILNWCKLILDSYVASTHYLLITNRDDLKFLTEYADEVIPHEQWNVGLFASVKKGTENKSEASLRVKDYWHKNTSADLNFKRPVMEDIKSAPEKLNGVARVTLDLIEPDEKNWNSRSHGIGVLFYVAFMVTVLMDSD